MDKTQVAVLFALLAGMREALDAHRCADSPPDQFDNVECLIHAAESVMSGLEIRDERGR